LLFLAAQIKKK